MFRHHVRKQLSAYCHGELPAAESARVAAHLRDCARCREEHELIRRGVELAQQLLHDPAPASLWNEIASALDKPLPRSWFARPAYQFAAIGAVALPLVCVGIFWVYSRWVQPDPPVARIEPPAWDVLRIDGQPRVGERQIAQSDRMMVGEWLTTDDASRAEIRVGEIGELTVEPNSRLRLIEARQDDHRVSLARGKLNAVIWAPPLRFFVDTPSAVAADLGCAYTLEVNDDGLGLLRVDVGVVAFESQGRESFVPEGAMCITRPGLGPGTPYFIDASARFREALARFDTGNAGVDAVLALARKRDALTLWHLLARTDGPERSRVFDRLSKLVSPPAGVTREGVLTGDRSMLDAWGNEFELVDLKFWRAWKRPLPK
jgi:hypothetical protein